MMQPRAGALLVATHELTDPNFAGTVVLLLDCDEDGTVGVVLNRPSDVPVSEPLPDCRQPLAAPEMVFVGGPVGRDTVIAVGTGSVGDAAWQGIRDGVGIVDLDRPAPAGMAGVRVFAGYAGWGPGQLRAEIDEGAWWLVDAAADDLVTPEPATLWRRVLMRQGGLFRTVPDDPTLN
jgi:putative transcriptional regulator